MPGSLWPFLRTIVLLLLSLLAACGGGGGDSAPQAPPVAVSSTTATDTFNAINLRRQQAGLPALARNALLDLAAQAHSDYQRQNGVITHAEQPGKPGFTGAGPVDRLAAAGYRFTQPAWAYGEVLVATGNPIGASVVDALLVAIYHRFILLEPRFKEMGAGSASVPDGYTYVTVDLAADGLGPALAPGTVTLYPIPGQQQVPTIFFSDNEEPDPVPNLNAVGYPISVQAGLATPLTVDSFTIQPHGGAPLAVKLLTHAQDAETPDGAAAIVPLTVLQAATTYDVQFSGSAGGQAVSRTWSFTTM